MNIEIINTGTELLLGRILNTHQQWLGSRLASMGLSVRRQTAVPDTGPAIVEAVGDALGRAHLVVVTGGLGPTSDDLTRDQIARMLGCELREDPAIVEHIAAFFAQRQRPMPPSTRVQAMVPQGARVLPNPYGTAPGLAFVFDSNPFSVAGEKAVLVLLPGPPRELQPMWLEQIEPLIRREFPARVAYVCRVYRVAGMGESQIEERITESLKPYTDAGVELAYCSHPGDVELRLAGTGKAIRKLAGAEAALRGELGVNIYGGDDDNLEAVVVRLLRERRQTLGLAESCTGGLLAHRITNVPGASAVLKVGLVTYSNAAKQQCLGVSARTLEDHGAVSPATAAEMAEGVQARFGADYALAITGIAGPGGGTATKPVGSVYIALALPEGTKVFPHRNVWDRETFKRVTTQQALDHLRRELLATHSIGSR